MGKFKDIWDRDKDGENQEKRSFVRYAIVTTVIFIILVGFVNQDSILRWVKAGIQIQKQERLIETYRQDIEDMDRQIHALRSSKDSLEQFARERFNFAEPGDSVYLDPD